MNTFRTLVQPSNFPFKISHTDRIMCLGSCFTENIGYLLAKSKFSVLINSFGIIYNPISICKALSMVVDDALISSDDLICINDRYYHWDFHGDFSGTDPAQTAQFLNDQIQETKQFLKETEVLFITLGTANAFQLKSENRLVANCHKFPNDKFSRKELSVNEITRTFQSTFDKLKLTNPKQIGRAHV